MRKEIKQKFRNFPGRGSPHKRIAPRVRDAKGKFIVREQSSGGLPPDVKQRIREIAEHDRVSMSWLKEQTLIAVFRIPMPNYVAEKPKAVNNKKGE